MRERSTIIFLGLWGCPGSEWLWVIPTSVCDPCPLLGMGVLVPRPQGSILSSNQGGIINDLVDPC